jgi:hypothetical protein
MLVHYVSICSLTGEVLVVASFDDLNAKAAQAIGYFQMILVILWIACI